jgi:hypothetical protein
MTRLKTRAYSWAKNGRVLVPGLGTYQQVPPQLMVNAAMIMTIG